MQDRFKIVEGSGAVRRVALDLITAKVVLADSFDGALHGVENEAFMAVPASGSARIGILTAIVCHRTMAVCVIPENSPPVGRGPPGRLDR